MTCEVLYTVLFGMTLVERMERSCVIWVDNGHSEGFGLR